MELLTLLWLCGSISGTCYLCIAYETSFAFDRPLYLGITTLALTGTTNVLLSLLRNRLIVDRSETLGREYFSLSSRHQPHASRKHDRSRNSSPATFVTRPHEETTSKRRLRAIFIVLVAVICGRIELARWVIRYDQCSRASWAPIVPAALLLYIGMKDYRASAEVSRSLGFSETFRSYGQDLIKKRGSFVLPIVFSTTAAFMIMSATEAQASTYICRISGPFLAVIPLLQVAGSLIDILLLFLFINLVHPGRLSNKPRPDRAASVFGWTFLVAGVIIILMSSVTPIMNVDPGNWRQSIPRLYVPDAIKLACAFACTITCIIQLVCIIGLRLPFYIIPFTAINSFAAQAAWRHRSPFPPISNTWVLFALVLANLSLVLAIRDEAKVHNSSRVQSARISFGVPRRVFVLLLFLLGTQFLLWGTRQHPRLTVHPLDELIASAEELHTAWYEQATTSRSLSDAASAYRDRYGGDPPPGFDRWFNYATLNAVEIIDDFDSIHDDLLPFWALSPEEIRLRTWELMSNPWNYAGGVTIRKGRVDISPQVADTHRWMLEGVQEMIKPFSKWLPDMDIAINMNDECRVAVPFRDLEAMKRDGRNVFKPIDSKSSIGFSANRASTWKKIPEEAISETRLRDLSLLNSFYGFGSVGCSPSSKARHQRHWELRSQCSSCAAPHTYHQFVSNWIEAASPCHQPDLGDLHGLHSSPASFKSTNELLPIFSQSKAPGYNDILYPSAWNYRDKIMYDPSKDLPDPDFLEKDATLFWRGGSTEGRSVGNGAWRGMSRQRLVHLFENATSHDRYLILLPDSSTATGPTFSYHNLGPGDIHVQAKTDLRFVDHIERCAWADCDDQLLEFAPEYVEPADFQTHWVNRYLFDVDGAGFSGRFLPFLQSKSLPFKASLMREWWDSRLTPWKHFVPVDIRLTEAWSLLAYFAGWKSPGMGEEEWLMPPHHEQAERIAMEGRDWVEKALRKEDMEVYLFRLLLEWGRLTDDARNELGYRADLVAG